MRSLLGLIYTVRARELDVSGSAVAPPSLADPPTTASGKILMDPEIGVDK